MNVKETSEFLKGNLELLVFLISRLKDGADLGDAAALYQKITSNAQFRVLMVDAYKGISAMKDEVRELDLAESIELTSIFLAYLPRLVAAVK